MCFSLCVCCSRARRAKSLQGLRRRKPITRLCGRKWPARSGRPDAEAGTSTPTEMWRRIRGPLKNLNTTCAPRFSGISSLRKQLRLLGGCRDYGIARLAPHNQRACQQQTAKHHADGKRQKESRDVAEVGAPGTDRHDPGPIACGPGGGHVEVPYARENKCNGPSRDDGRDRYSDRDRVDHVTYAVTEHGAERSGCQHCQPVEAIRAWEPACHRLYG